MIDDLDRSLERLLRTRVPLPADQYDVSFELPSGEWMKRLSAGRRTVNLYLYDVRENHGLRETEWRTEMRPDGTMVRKRPRVRMDLFYAVTTWSSATPPDPFDEHRLLGQLMRTLLRYPTLPPEVLQGSLAGQSPPLPTLVAQPEGSRNPWELWSSIGNKLRPALHLVVTVGVEPAAEPEPPVVVAPVVSRRMEVGGDLLSVLRVQVRPPLAAPLAAGTEVRVGRVVAAASAKLRWPVANSPLVVSVADARTLLPNEWYMIDGGPVSDFFRLPAAPGTGPAVLRMEPPLRWAHPAAREVRALALSAPLSRLAGAAAAGATRLQLESGAGIGDGEWLMVEDGARTELVLTAPRPVDAARVPAARPLRWPHPAGTLVRRATPGATAETQLAAAANRGADAVTLTARAPLDNGTLAEGVPVLLGAGAEAEVRVAGPVPAAPSTILRLLPAPAGNHAAGTALRRIDAPDAAAGRLAANAPAGATEILVAGDGVAAITAGVPLRAGTAAWVRVESAAPDVVPGGGDTQYRLEGRVVADAPGAPPVAGARVVVQELAQSAVTGADGRFVFSALPPGGYTLAASAPGFADRSQPAAVPAAGTEEYTVKLSSA